MTLTLAATPDSVNYPPRVRLDVVGTSPISPTAPYSIVRNDTDGRARPVIAALNATLTTGTATVYDYHAPFNTSITYSVTASNQTASSAAITLASVDSWLMHRTNPALSVKIDKVTDIGERSVASTAALHWVYGAQYPVAKNEGIRHARSGQLIIRCDSQGNHEDVLAVLADSGAVLLNFATNPDEDMPSWWDETWTWVQPLDLTLTNPAGGWTFYPYRHVTIPYQVVDTPVASTVPLWTWADVATTYPTWAAFTAAYSTWGNAAIDFRAI